MQLEEQIFIDGGVWFKSQIEERVGKSLEEIQLDDVDDFGDAFDADFLDQVRDQLIRVGRAADEVEMTRRLGLMLSLAFSTWFTAQ
ncbi:MAG: hypothetical protein HQL53_00635 [Magnetococcales bacterium]|nr:hypothetical protein [Magnetococcales bacterium]